MLKYVIDNNSEAQQAFYKAGISMIKKRESERGEYQIVIVDVEKKWKLVSLDAELYLRANRTLLSLFVNVTQGHLSSIGSEESASNAVRKVVLEAQAKQVRRSTGGLRQEWFASTEAYTLASRGCHSGKFAASAFKPSTEGAKLTTQDVKRILSSKMTSAQIDDLLRNVQNAH